MIETLMPAISEATSSFDKITPERKQLLQSAADAVIGKIKSGKAPDLTFICTSNSRRSHLGQVWAQTAATYYGLTTVRTFSGGTEATACNPRTVRALRRAGFSVVLAREGKNPEYLIQYSETAPPVVAFSKLYKAPSNPQTDFIAMMCCADGDANCPPAFGAVARIPLHYQDPKSGDGTPEESKGYDIRSKQIASEMFYLFSRVSAAVEKK